MLEWNVSGWFTESTASTPIWQLTFNNTAAKIIHWWYIKYKHKCYQRVIINSLFIWHKGDILRTLVNEAVSSDQLCLLATVKLKIRPRASDSIWVTFFDAHYVDWCSDVAAGDSQWIHSYISSRISVFHICRLSDTFLSQMPSFGIYCCSFFFFFFYTTAVGETLLARVETEPLTVGGFVLT